MIINRRYLLRASLSTVALPLVSLAEQFDYAWKLGIITDEVAPDLAKVLRDFYPKYSLKWAEIRNLSLAGKDAYVYRAATPEQLRMVRKQLDDAGVKLSVIDTAIYKIPLPGTKAVDEDSRDLNPASGTYSHQLEDLKHACDAAHALGTTRLRIFAFKRVQNPNEIFQRIVDELGKAITVASAHGIVLVLENEYDCNVGTGTETGRLFRAIPDHTLMHNWDPGNCIEAGEQPFPKAWDQLDHSRIVHVHLKDSDGHQWLPIGGGNIDFAGQFQALKQMKYQGTMSLETHYKNAAKNPYTSSVESMDGLVRVLKQV